MQPDCFDSFLDLAEDPGYRPAVSGRPVVFCCVPYEKTSTYGQGSVQGPAAILEASRQIELFDEVLEREVCRDLGRISVDDLRPLSTRKAQDLEKELFRHVANRIEQGCFVITLGGEHTSICGAVRAHCAAYEDVTVLHFDAHADLRDTYEDSQWNHACAMARVRDYCSKTVHVGIRSISASEYDKVTKSEIPCFFAHTVKEDVSACVSEITGCLSKKVYISFDCDVMDPSIMPATGTPEPNGLLWNEVTQILEAVALSREIVGFDVSELAPIPGINHPQVLTARLIYRLLGYIFPG